MKLQPALSTDDVESCHFQNIFVKNFSKANQQI